MLVYELNEAIDFIRSRVPVILLKHVICDICYQNVRLAFFQMFRQVMQIKDEVKLRNIKNAQNRKGVCINCITF